MLIPRAGRSTAVSRIATWSPPTERVSAAAAPLSPSATSAAIIRMLMVLSLGQPGRTIAGAAVHDIYVKNNDLCDIVHMPSTATARAHPRGQPGLRPRAGPGGRTAVF